MSTMTLEHHLHAWRIATLRRIRRASGGQLLQIGGGFLLVYALFSLSILQSNLSALHVRSIDLSFQHDAIRLRRLSSATVQPSESSLPNQNITEFSACLLVMDDSHFLPEWLAYHYHTAKLRTLIVAIDPRSQTSPKSILDKWRDMIDITQWKEDDYMTDSETQNPQESTSESQDDMDQSTEGQFRMRQRKFYSKCLQTLKQQGKQWTLLLDTDEFLAINYKTARSHQLTRAISTPDQPNAVARFVQEYTSLDEEKPRLVHSEPLYMLQSSPCVQIPRIRYATNPGTILEPRRQVVPDGYKESKFLTLRWRSHAQVYDSNFNGVSKVMLDLSRVSSDDLGPMDDIHLPIPNHCRRSRLYTWKPQSLLVVHHYLGTLEQYTYRQNDARGGKERSLVKWYKYKNITQAETDDDEVRPWIQGFHEENPDTASHLLEGVGELQPKSWTSYLGDSNTDRCALCFFGTPLSFQSMALPSIILNLLIPNARHNCDVYVHYYKQSEHPVEREDINDDNDVNNNKHVRPNQVYLLMKKAVRAVQKDHFPPKVSRTYRTPIVAFKNDTETQFWQKRSTILSKYNITRETDGQQMRNDTNNLTLDDSSMEHVLKEWHSMQAAFELMEEKGKQMGVSYSRVGMFPLDAMYLTPVDLAMVKYDDDIDVDNKNSVVAGFSQMTAKDRVVYGPYEAVKIWSTQRFNMMEERAKPGKTTEWALHPERFQNEIVYPAMETGDYKLNVNNDICFVQTRNDQSASISDCQMGGVTWDWVRDASAEAIQRIVGHKCKRFQRGSAMEFVGCGRGIDYSHDTLREASAVQRI